MAKWVYLFSEGNANMRNLLGGKGANLAEMTNLAYRSHRVSLLQLKLVQITMTTERRSLLRFRHRSSKH